MKTNEVSFSEAKRKLFNSLILAALVVPGMALAEDGEFTSHKEGKHVIPASEHTFTANVGLTSDYVFNGISQNFRTPALQGGFDYAHSSGLYLGTWASSISGNQYTNASMEWDVYGGYNGKVNDDLGYNIGLMEVVYPGGKTSLTAPNKKWDTSELLLGGTWKGLNIKYTYTLTDWYGISSANGGGFEPFMIVNNVATANCASDNNCAGNLNSKGSGYIEANYTYEVSEGLTVTGHAGHQKVKNFGKLSYTDYKLGVNKTYAGFNFGLAYTKTNATDNQLYHVITAGDNKKLGGSILALSVSRSF
ncbi:MAG: TorF family putative porin [Gallionella sp.]|nr:TorF family putative porin [Gallionella sp.]